MKKLIGKKINKIFIDSIEQHYMKFETNSGDVCFAGDGDCCSETYFSDVQNINNLIGQIVKSEEEIELQEGDYPKKESRQDEDSVYGIKLITDSGESIIVYRNSSNGYYGGYCNFCKEIPADIKMIEINKDYSSDD